MSAPETQFYVTGGTLRADAPSYVERQADTALCESLLRSEFCYVLTSRQMGKSSLMVRTAQKLRAAGVTVALLDLTSVGQNLAPEQWYNGLLTRLGAQTGLDDELDAFWWKNESLGPCQRFFTAVERIVLPGIKSRPARAEAAAPQSGGRIANLVLFIDELDVVRSLSFSTDEFFGAIREFYTRRAEDSEFNQITFALLGVATPSDLIRDTRLTPFNIGLRIELKDFTEQEASPLAEALGQPPRLAQAMLRRILYWTSGHPYLTQRLCQAVVNNPAASGARGVDQLCRDIFFSHRARERDDNLLFVRERLLRSEADLIRLLRLYRRVHRSTQIAGFLGFAFALRKIEPVADEETNPLISILQLSGVAKVQNGILRVRNRIYYGVFDQRWIEANMPVAELWRRWLVVWGMFKRVARLVATVFLLLLLLGIAAGVWLRPWERVRWEPPPDVRRAPRPKPLVPPRDPRATPALVDLSNFYNAALNKPWHPGPLKNSLEDLPTGLPTFGGTTFDVRGVVQLSGHHLWREGFPSQVTGIKVRQKCGRLHFLHATGWNVRDGTQIGYFVIHYADGRHRFIPILFGQDVSDWIARPNDRSDEDMPTIAWKGPSSGGTTGPIRRLFKSTWRNPFPETEIAFIDYVSTKTEAAPFLIAISIESL